MLEFDLTKQFQKTIGNLLESIDDANYIAMTSGNFADGQERVTTLIKKELWNMHDIIKLNVENELLKSKVGE